MTSSEISQGGTAETTVTFLIAGAPVPSGILAEEHLESPHTGRRLQVITVEFRAISESARLTAAEAISNGAILETADGRRFEVLTSSHRYTEGDPTTYFQLTAKEVEEIRATRLLLGGTAAVVPEKYKERADEQSIVIECITTVSAADAQALEGLLTSEQLYFPVIREGVRLEPLEMRFGQCRWSAADDGAVRHLLVLVDKSYDDRDETPMLLNEPTLSRAIDAICDLQQIIDGLLERLVATGALTTADAATIRRTSRDVPAQRRQFDRTDRLDDFWLD